MAQIRLRTGVLVTCRAALDDDQDLIAMRGPSVAASISQNGVWGLAQEVRASRPDAHTIVLRWKGDEVLRVRHLAPGSVQVQGELWAEPGQAIDLRHGIRWPGGAVLFGAVDLTPQGEGKIDLKRNGSIRVVAE